MIQPIIDELKKKCDKVKKSNDWSDYEALEFDILNVSFSLATEEDKFNNDEKAIDDLIEDAFVTKRTEYSSDAGATKAINKEFRKQKAPLVVREWKLKKRDKQLKASIRRAETIKSRQIKTMADEKRQSSFTS
jgi:hypothetical protein